MTFRVVTLVAVATALAACGGSDGDDHYTLSATKACLTAKEDVRAKEWQGETGNLRLAKAPEGELIVSFARNELALFFDRNAADAKETRSGVERFNNNFVEDWNEALLGRRSNVTFEWKNTPNTEEQAVFDECLS